jgi:protein TonB
MAAGSARGTAWQDGARRALEYALVASLALHALALLSLPSLPSLRTPPAPAQPPLEARLMPARPVEAPRPPPPPPPPPKIEPQPAPQSTPHPAPRPVLKKARPVRERAPEPAPQPVPVITAPAPAPLVAPVAQPQPPVAAAPPPAPAPAPRAAPRPDAASLAAQYRAALMAEAARYKRYPRFARDNGWQGRVELHLAIGADGAIASLRVARGTGYSILDQQALEMVRSAKPQIAIPEGLRGKPFSVEIPVLFSLREPDA